MWPVKIYVDGQLVGEVLNGGRFAHECSPGGHDIELRGGGLRCRSTFLIQVGGITYLTCYFSDWGFLGGGLKFA